MESWVYTQGKLKGLEEGKEEGWKEGKKEGKKEGLIATLRSAFERRAGRPPTPAEEQAIVRRAQDLSPEKVVDVLEMPADAFLAWLLAAS